MCIRDRLRQTQRIRLIGRKQESDRTNVELDEAAVIQRTLMTHNVGNAQGIDVAADCKPARSAGGDLYEVCLLYTSDAAEHPTRVDLGGSRTLRNKNHCLLP